MCRRFALLMILALAWVPAAGRAQTPPAADPDTDPAEEPAEEPAGDLDEEDDEVLEEPQLRAPEIEPIDVDDDWGATEEDAVSEEPLEPVDPNEANDLLRQAEPAETAPAEARWTAPAPVFTLHGYLRTRGELQDNFFLRRDRDDGSDFPFSLFVPGDRGEIPEGGCRGSASTTGEPTEACRSDKLKFANMRLRLAPTLSLSDDVKVHMMVDVFDNLVLGSTPNSEALGSSSFGTAVPLDSLATAQVPPQSGINNLRDSIYVRRAWAEVTNRGLGQLRFGRMGAHWGLGLYHNDGRGIDADVSTDVDRIMGITKLAGFYLTAAWDFGNEGVVQEWETDANGVPYDLTNKDDLRRGVFSIARRFDEETQEERLQRGDWVLNGGLQFIYQSQFLSSAGTESAFPGATDELSFVRRRAKAFVPDLWAQFLWKDLRLELEAVFVAGEIKNIQNDSYEESDIKLRQFGFAFESEYRLLDDKLQISFHTGFATGDADVNGLSGRQNLVQQQTEDDVASTFAFHPNYRIDLILWRNIMGQVAGAWYFKPGVGYDLIRSPFGRLFGARVDFVYSRASKEVQAYGGDPNLGFEIDAQLYYRSEDGPDVLDGFYAAFHYGLLFPLAGLSYRSYTPPGSSTPVRERPRPDDASRNQSIGRAQTLRLVLGVQF